MSADGAWTVFRSMIEYGRETLRAAMLINGGAAVALLAFIGAVWEKKEDSEVVFSLAFALAFYSLGVLAAVLACASAYFTQYFQNERNSRLDPDMRMNLDNKLQKYRTI